MEVVPNLGMLRKARGLDSFFKVSSTISKLEKYVLLNGNLVEKIFFKNRLIFKTNCKSLSLCFQVKEDKAYCLYLKNTVSLLIWSLSVSLRDLEQAPESQLNLCFLIY